MFVQFMQINEPWRDVIKLIAEKYVYRSVETKKYQMIMHYNGRFISRHRLYREQFTKYFRSRYT